MSDSTTLPRLPGQRNMSLALDWARDASKTMGPDITALLIFWNADFRKAFIIGLPSDDPFTAARLRDFPTDDADDADSDLCIARHGYILADRLPVAEFCEAMRADLAKRQAVQP